MSIVDPMGRPVSTKDSQQAELMKILGGHRQKIMESLERTEQLFERMVQLGLLVEYLYERMTVVLDEHNRATGMELSIEVEKFPEWAEERIKLLQEATKEHLAMKTGAPDIKLEE